MKESNNVGKGVLREMSLCLWVQVNSLPWEQTVSRACEGPENNTPEARPHKLEVAHLRALMAQAEVTGKLSKEGRSCSLKGRPAPIPQGPSPQKWRT